MRIVFSFYIYTFIYIYTYIYWPAYHSLGLPYCLLEIYRLDSYLSKRTSHAHGTNLSHASNSLTICFSSKRSVGSQLFMTLERRQLLVRTAVCTHLVMLRVRLCTGNDCNYAAGCDGVTTRMQGHETLMAFVQSGRAAHAVWSFFKIHRFWPNSQALFVRIYTSVHHMHITANSKTLFRQWVRCIASECTCQLS